MSIAQGLSVAENISALGRLLLGGSPAAGMGAFSAVENSADVGFTFWGRTNVASANPIVLDGAIDVRNRVIFLYVILQGTASAAATATLAPSGTLDVVVGTGTWRFRVGASGQFEVLRNAGTGTATIGVAALFL